VAEVSASTKASYSSLGSARLEPKKKISASADSRTALALELFSKHLSVEDCQLPCLHSSRV
jgi:hypothetical protein